MQQTLVILVVGLAPNLVGEHTPNLTKLAARGGMRAVVPPVPAVTCTSQSTLLTGAPPSVHGAVANGWYFRDSAEVLLWRQANHLMPIGARRRARNTRRMAVKCQITMPTQANCATNSMPNWACFRCLSFGGR